MITPIEKHEDIYIKREDLFVFKEVCGGKVRSALQLCRNAKGLVTAGSRHSPQIKIIAEIANDMNVPLHAHTSFGSMTPELQFAIDRGAKIFQCKPGFNNAIIGRAKKDAFESNMAYIPFGMDCEEAIEQTSEQVIDIPKDVKRIVVTVGSGISFLGVARGLKRLKLNIPLIGIRVGSDPTKRFIKYKLAYTNYTIIKSTYDYADRVTANIGDIELDPIYEAKCCEFLQKGDLFWIVGKR